MERSQGSHITLRGHRNNQKDLSLDPSTVAVGALMTLPLSCQALAGHWERMSQLQCQAPSLLTTGTPNSTERRQVWLHSSGSHHPWRESSRGTLVTRPAWL